MLGLAVFFLSVLQGSINAQIFDTRAKQALLMEANSGTILFSKNADEKIPPASLAKLMTIEVVFHRLKQGTLSLEDKFLVSENAWRRGGANSGGSTMFAELNSEISLEDLIKGVIVQSANDGCIIIAEGLAGSEEAFSSLMNERARALGLENSHFTNSTGLPDENQYVTAADLVILARHIITEYPQYFSYYSLPDFEWNGIKQRNRNPLLSRDIGADGMKTGFTKDSGYAIVGTAKDAERRLIAVLSGMKSSKARSEEAHKIISWGFRAFEEVGLLEPQTVVGAVSVYGGHPSTVSVRSQDSIRMFLPVGNRDRVKIRIAYNHPIKPPISEGDKIARLKIWIGDELRQEVPLYANESVESAGIFGRATAALTELMTSWIPR